MASRSARAVESRSRIRSRATLVPLRVELLKNRDSRFYVTERHQLEIALDGQRVGLFTIEPLGGRRNQNTNADTMTHPSLRLPVFTKCECL